MNKNKRYVFLIVLAAAVTAAWLLNIKMNASGESEKQSQKRLEDLVLPEKKDQAQASNQNQLVASGDAAVANIEKGKNIQEEFKKCFKKETSVQTLEDMKENLLQQKDYSKPSVDEENYNLVTNEGQNLVVQHIPLEENENKVRVFSINPTDGLPDRIKDFPQNSAEVSLRLKGALGMGSIKSKTISTIQSAYDGSLLSIDQKDEQVIRIHLITTSFDFECKEQSCLCLKKD